MPVMDGYEATKQIRMYEQENELKGVPVIALTGHALKNVKVFSNKVAKLVR